MMRCKICNEVIDYGIGLDKEFMRGHIIQIHIEQYIHDKSLILDRDYQDSVMESL